MLNPLLRWSVLPLLFVGSVSVAQTPAHLEPGPYKVGYTQFVLSRTDANFGTRQTVVSVFYPVDPSGVSDATPRPDFWVFPGATNRVIPSPAFDRFGFEPSYSGPPVAPGGPFPLVLYMPGGNAPWL